MSKEAIQIIHKGLVNGFNNSKIDNLLKDIFIDESEFPRSPQETVIKYPVLVGVATDFIEYVEHYLALTASVKANIVPTDNTKIVPEVT